MHKLNPSLVSIDCIQVLVYLYLDDEYLEFLKRNFPDYNKKMVTVPVSFQYKDVQGLKTHGIVKDDRGRQESEISKEEKDWYKKVSGLRAEQTLFDEIQRQFSDQPCLLINGFNEQNLIKVVKSTLQKRGKYGALNDEVNTNF